jgi:AcrR family transcriptional regulator
MKPAMSPAGAVGRPRSAAVDTAILVAALALFADGGLAAASFEKIAQRAQVSRSAIYRRWRSREDLIAFALGWLRQRSEAPLGDWTGRSLDEMLEWLVAETPKAMLDPFYRRLMVQTVALGPHGAGLRQLYWDAFVQPRSDVFTRLIAQAQASGRVTSMAAPALLQDMLAGALLQRMLLDPAEPTEASLRTYLEDILDALGLRPRAPRERS